MECHILLHCILVFIVCQTTYSLVSSTKRVKLTSGTLCPGWIQLSLYGYDLFQPADTKYKLTLFVYIIMLLIT